MKAQPNEHGVTWAASKAGRIQIAVGAAPGQPAIDVWAIWTGTHDVAPLSRRFTGPDADAEARAYANTLWRTR